MKIVSIKINKLRVNQINEMIDYDHDCFDTIHELANEEFNRTYAKEHEIYGVIASHFKVIEKKADSFVIECSLNIQHWDTPNSSWCESDWGLVEVILG
jgi:hypothetical protein